MRVRGDGRERGEKREVEKGEMGRKERWGERRDGEKGERLRKERG